MIFGAAQFQVDVKEEGGEGGGKGSDLNVQLTLSRGESEYVDGPLRTRLRQP